MFSMTAENKFTLCLLDFAASQPEQQCSTREHRSVVICKQTILELPAAVNVAFLTIIMMPWMGNDAGSLVESSKLELIKDIFSACVVRLRLSGCNHQFIISIKECNGHVKSSLQILLKFGG